MEHALTTIARNGSLPMQKANIPAEGMDARMQAVTLVAEVMAKTRNDDRFWHGCAVRLIEGTTDFRAAFVKGLDAELKQLKKDNAESIAPINREGKPDPTKDDRKLAATRVNTATTYASNLRVIANGFNSGGTIDGLLVYAKETGRRNHAQLNEVGWVVMVEYARKFVQAKAGRKADPWLIKFGKWLESQGKPAEDDVVGQEQHALIVAQYNALVKKYAPAPKSAAEQALM